MLQLTCREEVVACKQIPTDRTTDRLALQVSVLSAPYGQGWLPRTAMRYRDTLLLSFTMEKSGRHHPVHQLIELNITNDIMCLLEGHVERTQCHLRSSLVRNVQPESNHEGTSD